MRRKTSLLNDSTETNVEHTNSNIEQADEYRIISGGEDGNICFWNFELKRPSKIIHEKPSKYDQGTVMEIEVRPKQLNEIKPIYMLQNILSV